MPLALSTGHEVGLAVTAAAFIIFALASSFLFPRFRPNYPGGGMLAFVVVSLVFFFGMLTAVETFGAEGGEAGGEHAAETAEPTHAEPAHETGPPVTASETVYSPEPVIAEAANPPVPAEVAPETGPAGVLPVEGAAANALPDPVPDEVKEERWHRFMQAQQKISARRLAAPADRTRYLRELAAGPDFDLLLRVQAIQGLAALKDTGAADLLGDLLDKGPRFPMPNLSPQPSQLF